MEQESDLLLLNGIQKGDSDAFELLFRKYYASLCVFAVKYIHDSDSAREIVQDLFVSLWENRANIGIEKSLKSYLTVAVRHNCVRFLKQQNANRPIDTLSENEYPEDYLYDSLELDELYKQLLNAIEQLPEQCKKIFKLSRFEELKYSEIAEKLGLSVKTIETQMGRALKMLREKFKNKISILWVLLFKPC